jgi:hypothetical protein
MDPNTIRVLKAIYKLGDQGARAVSIDEICKESNLLKGEVLAAIEEADGKGFIIDATTHDGLAWMLKLKGRAYMEDMNL